MDRCITLPKVKSFYNKDIHTFETNSNVFSVIKNIINNPSSYSAIIDYDSVLLGVLLDKDVIHLIENTLFFDEQFEKTIIELISKPIGIASPEWNILELENYFTKNNISSALVVDSNNKLLGDVSRKNILKKYGELLIARLNYKIFIKKPIEVSLYDKVNSLS